MSNQAPPKALLSLKACLDSLNPSLAGERLLHLTPNTQAALKALPSIHLDPSHLSVSPEWYLLQIHWSWLAEELSQLSSALRQLYFNSLAPSLAQKVGMALQERPLFIALPPIIREFFHRKLLQQLFPPDLLPYAFLPDSPLNLLLSLTKRQLVRLIGFLGIHDLSRELRRIVDRRLLQQLTQHLTVDQRRYLDRCLQQQEPLALQELGFLNAAQDLVALNRLLQLRGLMRMGRALAHEDSSFRWYLARRLDKGRGNLLIRYASQEVKRELSHRFRQQILDLLQYFNPMQKR